MQIFNSPNSKVLHIEDWIRNYDLRNEISKRRKISLACFTPRETMVRVHRATELGQQKKLWKVSFCLCSRPLKTD